MTMTQIGNKKIGIVPTTPGIAPEIQGAPLSAPGSGSEKPTAQVEGKPVEVANVSPAISPELEGAPHAGDKVNNVADSTTAVTNKSKAEADGNEPIASAETETETGTTAIRPIRAYIPPSFSPDLDGAPHSGQMLTNSKKKEGEASEQNDDKKEAALNKQKEAVKENKDETVSNLAPQVSGELGDFDSSGYDRKINTLQDIIERLSPPESEEDRKKRERKEKSAKIISAISDGLSSLSNLFFTTRYAPNMYNHEKTSQLAGQNAAIERAKKEREANADRYLNFALKLGDIENERANAKNNHAAANERMRMAKEEAKRKAMADAAKRALDPFNKALAKAKQKYWENKAAIGKAEADEAPKYYKARTEKEKSVAAKNRRLPAKGGGGSGKGKGSSGGSYGIWTAYDSKGNKHTFPAKGKGHAENIADGEGWTISGYDNNTERTKSFKGGSSSKSISPRTGGGAKMKKKNRLGL